MPGAVSVHRPPAIIGIDEFQPAIPWQVALPQSSPPLHRPHSECDKVFLPVENFAANGEQSLICLSHPRGQPHSDRYSCIAWSRASASGEKITGRGLKRTFGRVSS